MKRYASISDFQTMPLAQIEKTLDRYLQIAGRSEWAVTPAFLKQLEMLTNLAKAKGSKRRW